jgi:hypothetical protein
MAEKLTPEALIGEVAELLSEQDTLEGIFAAAERCLAHLETNNLFDPERAVLAAALLLETTAALVVDSRRTVAAALPILLDRKRGRLGSSALSQSRQRERQSFSVEKRGPADRPRPSEPAHLEEADRALARAIQRSIQELSATRFHLAVEWLRLKNDFFPPSGPLEPREQLEAWLVFRHWETHLRYPELDAERRWHAPPLPRSTPADDERPSRPDWVKTLPGLELWDYCSPQWLFASPVIKDHPLARPPQISRPKSGYARALYDKILQLAQNPEP